MDIVILFSVDIIVSGFALWLSAVLTGLQLSFKHALAAVILSTLVMLIPIIGWLLSILMLFYMLKHFSDANIWPDLILTVLFSKILYFTIVFMLPAF